MTHTEIDAKEVLDKYVALIRKTGGRGPQNLSNLPASKEVLKAVLIHVLKLSPPDADITPLKQAYLFLAAFQDQKAVAESSIDGWLAQMSEKTNSAMSDNELHNAARSTVSIRGFLDPIEEKIDLERALLASELKDAGF